MPTKENMLSERPNLPLLGARKILDDLGLNRSNNREEKGGPEHLLIVTNDVITKEVVRLFEAAAGGRGSIIHTVNAGNPENERTQNGLTQKENEALAEIQGLADNGSIDVVVKLADACEAFSDGTYGITESKKVRAREAQCPGLTLSDLASPAIFTDLDVIKAREQAMKPLLQNAKKIHIKGHASLNHPATDLILEFNPAEQVYSDPPLDLRKRIPQGEKGRGANFPTGEIWRNPRPTSVNGTIVLDNIDTSIPIYTDFSNPEKPDGKIDNTGKTNEPVVLQVEDGRIVSIKGGHEAMSLAYYLDQKFIEEVKRYNEEIKLQGHSDINPWVVKYFGTEVGIGANPYANLTEENGSTVTIEKQIQRMHIALGHTQTEYPYEDENSREYVRGPVHFDFTIPEEYSVEVETYDGEKYTLFGPAGRAEGYRRLHPSDLSYQVTDLSESSENGKSFKRIHVDIPPIILETFDDAAKEVIKLINSLEVIEYRSGKPGDMLIVTKGMHGEEADPIYYDEDENLPYTADDLDDELRQHMLSHDKGTMLLIPSLNQEGAKNKTRWVFDDEKLLNLNDCFKYYKTGSWKEFFELPSKTAQYAWLTMKYLQTKADRHKEEFGNKYKIYHFDRHREEDTLVVRGDRMWERKRRLTRLLNSSGTIEIPFILEDENWDKVYFDTLTAKACERGFISYTIEEGKTVSPDPLYAKYSVYQIMKFLADKGMIAVGDEWRQNYEEMIEIIDKTKPALAKMRSFWNKQQRTGSIYRWYQGDIELTDDKKNNLKRKDFIRHLLKDPSWDGIITAKFSPDLLGTRLGKAGKMIVADLETHHWEHHMSIKRKMVLTNPHADLWIINVPEPVEKGALLCDFAFFLGDDWGKPIQITLRKIGENVGGIEFKREDALKVEEINGLLLQGISLHTSRLGIDCAIPDGIWRGIKTPKGKVKLVRRK